MSVAGGPMIFTFWEPVGSIPPYLKLCMETWKRAGSAFRVVQLDYSNLAEWLGDEMLDLEGLRRVPLPMQKDAILVAILHRHGGVFMDMDTLITNDLSPILSRLRRTELVMFSQHLSFVAARPRGTILTRWNEESRRRIAQLASGERRLGELEWGYLGNDILRDLYRELIDRSPILRMVRRGPIGKRFWPSATRGSYREVYLATAGWSELGWRSWPRSIARSIVRASHARELVMLNRARRGFIAEMRYLASERMEPRDRYRRFWFESDVPVEALFDGSPWVIGLHHSWTPEWYRRLSREEVLAHECLLSRTLRTLVDA